MILTRLTLTDFGVFHGTQSFDLVPKRNRPIVLFGGKNGAGKSSILDAIRLCFYGPSAQGFRSRDEYLSYLSSKIHLNPTALIQPQFASIKVEFQYGDMRSLQTYAVTRDWGKKGSSKVHEALTVEKDGKPLDEVTAEHWQDFVRDLIPAGLSQLFFFDGEKIQELAEDTTDQATLAQAIKSLLGLDVVESLQTDLGVHLSRLSKPLRKEREPQLAEIDVKIASLKQLTEEAQGKRATEDNRVAELRGEIQKIEHQIASEGGGFVKNREKLLQEEAGCKARIEGYESSIRELCGGLLPFALVPELCLRLQDQLCAEDLQLRSRIGQDSLQAAAEEFGRKLPKIKVWDDLQLDKASRESATRAISALLLEQIEPKDGFQAEVVHNLSPGERDQLLSWIDQATNNVPGVLRMTAAELERCYDGLRHAQSELRKIPPDDVLRPLLQRLHELHAELGEVSTLALALDEQIRSFALELADCERRYNQGVERLAAEVSTSARIQLVPRIQKVLSEYKSTLLIERVLKLQDAVTDCFNILCRKKDSIRRIIIDPKDFSIVLQDRQGNPLKKSLLSAGEKQIYAVSMLWGLARTSGRPLPVIIDTPLARLDSDHRLLLARNYFPVASHQVLILSTDTEVDRAYFDELKPAVAHSYHLTFDGDLGGTTSQKGYFWKESDEAHQVEADKRCVEPVAVLGR